jgi:hypothetical protein
LISLFFFEEANFRRRERFAESRHSFFPFLFADNREPFDVVEVTGIELDVFPQRPASQP